MSTVASSTSTIEGPSLTEKGPFTFLKARYIVELTGKRASNLEQFLSCLKTVDRSSIFYHVYHPLLDAHLVPYEFPNDFSYWFSDTLQDKDLAEQVANFDLPEGRGGLESVRQILISRIEWALKERPHYDVRPGNEFNFVNCRIFVLPTSQVAKNLDELADLVSEASELSIFYHMVTSRVFSDSAYDDFSKWILVNTAETQLAEDIRSINPTTYPSVRSIHQDVVKTIERHVRTRGPWSAQVRER